MVRGRWIASVVFLCALMFASSASAQVAISETLTSSGANCNGAIVKNTIEGFTMNNCVVVNVRGAASVTFDVQITSGTATVQFERLFNNQWQSILDDIGGVSLTTASGSFSFTNPGYTQLRARTSANTGTVVVNATRGGSGLKTTATFSGSVSAPSAGVTGSAVPAQAEYTGVNIGGVLRGITGLSLGSHFAPGFFLLDASGNQVTNFGGGAAQADDTALGNITGFGALFTDTPGTLVSGRIYAPRLDSSRYLFTVFPSAQPVTQSGTWTLQPGNTANTTPWLMTPYQGGANLFPTAAAAADNMANPTATGVLSYTMCWDSVGGNWDRCGAAGAASAVDTELPTAAALADNTANPTIPAIAAFQMCWDSAGGNWDRCGAGGAASTVDSELPAAVTAADNLANPTAPFVLSAEMCFDGVTWDRCQPSDGGSGAATSNTTRSITATDSPDVTVLGATGDAAATQGSTGSISAKLRTMTAQLNTIATTGIPVTSIPGGATTPADNFINPTNALTTWALGACWDSVGANWDRCLSADGGSGAATTNTSRTIAATDSPEVTVLGATGDAAATQGSTGSISAKMRTLTAQMNTMVTTGIPITSLPAVVGNKTNNNAAPGANNIGTLGAVATAAAPTYTEGNQVSLSTDLSGVQRAGVFASSVGGCTPNQRISTASTNAVSVKAAAGQIYSIQVINTNAAIRWLKLYDKASAPTVGTDTPIQTLGIPPNSTTGGGFVLSIPVGMSFSTGIAFAITTGVAVTDTGATAADEVVLNYCWK